MKLDSFDIIITVFFDTKRRHDVDNQVPKFILDSFTESGFIVDDDEKHLHSLTLKTGYDKENPRTEIEVIIYDWFRDFKLFIPASLQSRFTKFFNGCIKYKSTDYRWKIWFQNENYDAYNTRK